MNVVLHLPPMTREQFLDWAAGQEDQYEFDGVRPVPMNRGTVNHYAIALNIIAALRSRLKGTGLLVSGGGLALPAGSNSVRCPDALVAATRPHGDERLVPDVLVVFEVVSPSSGRTDRIEKTREYFDAPSIRRYVIVERTTAAATVMERGETEWKSKVLTAGETLAMPEIGIEIPISEFYEDVELPDEPTALDGAE